MQDRVIQLQRKSIEELKDRHSRLREELAAVRSALEAREALPGGFDLDPDRYAQLLESSGSAPYRLLFSDMSYQYLSPTVETLTGYTPQEISRIGFSSLVTSIKTPGGEPLDSREIARRREKGKVGPYKADYLIKAKDGQERWLSDYSIPWLGRDGQVLGSIGVLSDIGERKHGEQRLVRQNHLLAALHDTALAFLERMETDKLLRSILERTTALMDTPHGWLAMTDPQGSRLKVAVGLGVYSAWEGYAFKPGEGVSGVVWREGRTIAVNDYQDMPEKVEGYGLNFLKPTVGVPLKVESVVGVLGLSRVEDRPFKDEEIELVSRLGELASMVLSQSLLFSSMQQEIARRRSSEQRLAESEETSRTLLNASGELVMLLDHRGRIQAVNAAGALRMGRSMDQLRGLRVDTLQLGLCGPDLWDKAREVVRSCEPRRIELFLGDAVWVTHIYPITNPGGDVTRLAVFTRDVTEAKRMEDRVRQSLKRESLDLVVGGVAHDFNNILGGISGYAELALMEMTQDAPGRLELIRIQELGDRAAKLTKQMQTYAGGQLLGSGPVDLNKVVRSAVRRLAEAGSDLVEIQEELTEPLPKIESDAGRIYQLVSSLLTNALEALGPDGGTVSVTTYLKNCDLKFLQSTYFYQGQPPGDYVTLRVADDGCGMALEVMAKLFDPFFSSKFIGRGLGLAAVLGLVRSHKGAIAVESAEGTGSVFEVFLPAFEQQQTMQASLFDSLGPRVEGTALVIDDDRAMRQIAGVFLERLGLKVVKAVGGREGLNLFKQLLPNIDLVLLDRTMPDLNGEAVMTEMSAIDPKVPVILTSGYSEHQLKLDLDKTGFAGFLEKPYRASQLKEIVAKALAG